MARQQTKVRGARTVRRPSQDELLTRLKAAKQSLSAIRAADVDGLVLLGRRKAQIVTLQGGESAYHLLVEAMSEGAATLSHDGIVLYCNRRFSELLGRPGPKVIGTPLALLVDKPQRERVPAFLKSARRKAAKDEFVLRGAAGQTFPAQLSLSPLRGYRGRAMGMVITDLTERKSLKRSSVIEVECLAYAPLFC